MKSALLSARDSDTWSRTLDRSRIPSAERFYYRSEYAELCANAVDGEGFLFVHEDDNDIFLFPIIARKIPNRDAFDFESPYGYPGVFSSVQNSTFLENAWKGFRETLAAKKIIAGFARFNPLVPTFPGSFFPDFLKYRPASEVVILELAQSENAIFDAYESNVRTNIRKAQKNDIRVEIDPSGCLDEFRKIYLQTMERVDAKDFYRFDERYFAAVQGQLKGSYSILYAKNSVGETVGGILLFLSGDVGIIHLSGCREDHLKLGVPSLLRHQAVLWLKENHFRVVNFGGGKSADPECSLLKFKSGFSSKRAQYYIGMCVIIEDLYRSFCEEWQKAHPGNDPKYFLKYRLD